MSLSVLWDGRQVGLLDRVAPDSREYAFEYSDRSRAISISLPTTQAAFSPAESRPFFEALLPEGAIRDQIAARLRLASSDSYGLLAQLGRDCAGALQIVETKRVSDPPSVRWLSASELDELIAALPQRPLGLSAGDDRVRLSLAGVQRKAVLVRSDDGTFGEPLSGMSSTHILKPDLAGSEYPSIAANESFCMRLAARCGLKAANVELISAAGRPCLVVERFDRDRSTKPARRLHQEDLCQALGLTPDFKYQHPDWQKPSLAALADLLDGHSVSPGADRLAAANATVFHFLIGNADAHAKNISFLYSEAGLALAPIYDAVSTAVYEDVSTDLALAIGDERDPAAIGLAHWSDLAHDLGLQPRAFGRVRAELVDTVLREAATLRDDARRDRWHEAVVDRIVDVIRARADQVR